MTTHPTIAALKAALESERLDIAAQATTSPRDKFDISRLSHEAATERLMGLLEKAVEMAKHYDGMYIFDEADDDTECLDINKPWRCYSGKKAREFLTTLADAGVIKDVKPPQYTDLYPKYKCAACGDWFHIPYKYCKCGKKESGDE
jgi:hypothetical protein